MEAIKQIVVKLVEARAITQVITQAAIEAAMIEVKTKEKTLKNRVNARQRNAVDGIGPKASGPSAKQSIFHLTAKDKYTELKKNKLRNGGNIPFF